MKGCFLSLLFTFAPRVILLVMWLFTPLVNLAFDNWLVPLLGFILLPFTALAYVIVWDPLAGVSFAGWALIIGGLLLDLGSYAVGIFATRSRRSGNSQS